MKKKGVEIENQEINHRKDSNKCEEGKNVLEPNKLFAKVMIPIQSDMGTNGNGPKIERPAAKTN